MNNLDRETFYTGANVAILDYTNQSIRFYKIPETIDNDSLEDYLRENCEYNDSKCYYICSENISVSFPNSIKLELLALMDNFVDKIASYWPESEPLGELDEHFMEEVLSGFLVESCQKEESDKMFLELFAEAVYGKIKENRNNEKFPGIS